MRGIRLILISTVLLGTLHAQYPRGGSFTGLLYPDWELLPPSVCQPIGQRPSLQRLLTERHPGYRRFLADAGGQWLVLWNEATFTPRRLVGTGIRVLPGALPGTSPEHLPAIDAGVREFLGRHPDLFPLDPWTDLRFEEAHAFDHLLFLQYTQTHDDVPVFGTWCEVGLASDGRAVHFRSDVVPVATLRERLDHSLPPASLERSRGVAVSRSREHGALRDHFYDDPPARRWVLPMRVEADESSSRSFFLGPRDSGGEILPLLVWEVRFPARRGDPAWSYFVTAAGSSASPAGSLLGRFDRSSRVILRGSVEGRASQGDLPDTDWNPPRSTPLGNLRVESGTDWAHTAPDGSFTLAREGDGDVPVEAPLRGPYCVVENAAGPPLYYRGTAGPGAPLNIRLNSEPTEFQTAQVNAFVEVNRAHDYVKNLDPGFTAIDVPVLARVNLQNDACNAFFTPTGNGILRFFRSDPCVNTAYSTWILHEYGHFVIWKAFGDGVPMPAYNEGMADALALLITDQPVIGKALDGGFADEGRGFSVSRDLSTSDRRYPDDVLESPHTSGLILGGALWTLRNRLISRYNPDHQKARDTLGRLWIQGLFLRPSQISPDLVLDLLILDDDDGNIFNGTSHFQEIVESFAAFGLLLPNQVEIEHEPLPDATQTGNGLSFPVEARVRSTFRSIRPEEVLLFYSLDGGNRFEKIPLRSAGDPEVFAGEIPKPGAATTVRYYIEARTSAGSRVTAPPDAPRDSTFVFAVGPLREIFSDLDGSVAADWTHGLVENGTDANEDDWQWGTIGQASANPDSLINGNLVDPPAAYSPPFHWGNDLALGDRTDKLYPHLAFNFLESPPIDCRGFHGIHLRFRRWLSSEKSDQLRVLVNGTIVYQTPATRDIFDREWRLIDHDISGFADDREEVRIRFELQSNSFGCAGGWNIDDLQLVSTGRREVPQPVIRAVEPRFDSTRGGSLFTIRGANFPEGQEIRVLFGSRSATAVAAADSSTINGIIPAVDVPGPVTITVTTPGGVGSLVGNFIYFGEPELETLLPSLGELRGGARVGVQGKYFTPDQTRVWIGGKELENPAFVNFNHILGTLPRGNDIGEVDVRIETRFGDATFPRAFTYTAKPVILQIEPSRSFLEGRIRFIILGESFPSEPHSVKVLFGDVRSPRIDVLSRGMLLGAVPARETPGIVDITLATPGGTAVLERAFTYEERDDTGPIFTRSDTNFDGLTDITDPIVILGALFLGTHKLSCNDAGDVNDDGSLDVTDAVYTLTFLFSGGPPPLPPYPGPGPDPTADTLDCRKER